MKTPFNQDIANMVCEMIASNNSLVTICNLNYMPELAVITQWLNHDSPQCKAFKKAYDFAKEVRADYLFEEIIDIADDTTDDLIELHDKKTGEFIGYRENKEFVNRSKVKIETRLKYISRLVPKKYGEKLVPDITDKDKLKDLIEVLAKGPAKQNGN